MFDIPIATVDAAVDITVLEANSAIRVWNLMVQLVCASAFCPLPSVFNLLPSTFSLLSLLPLLSRPPSPSHALWFTDGRCAF